MMFIHVLNFHCLEWILTQIDSKPKHQADVNWPPYMPTGSISHNL